MTNEFKPPLHQIGRLLRLFGWCAIFILSSYLIACGGSGTATTPAGKRQAEQPKGFFDKLADQVTERGCNVGRFICPFGLGPAGEPCECTDPSGYVLKGRTVK